jgi:hypothetical protein
MKLIIALFISLFLLSSTVKNASAEDVSKMGVHILNPGELDSAKELIGAENSEQWQYVTIPYTLEDVKRTKEWQAFFNEAKEKKIIPLVRLATKVENGSWQVPERKQIVMMLTILGQLDWPTEERHVIVFNEVNHAKEWGGTIDPEEYASIFRFTSSWARSENNRFVILPAAMDLAAPNGSQTREAFAYLEDMRTSDPEIFSYVDVWNSHSYPNPAFSASPQKNGKNSLRGFEYELAYLKEHTGKEFDVYITETGWEDNLQTRRWLSSYYQYAMRNIWSNPRVKAVTPFVLKGAPGPYAGFSFLSSNDTPTRHYAAFQNAIASIAREDRLLSQAQPN